MGSKQIRDTVLGKIVLTAICVGLLASCGETEQVIDPPDPLPPASLLELFGTELFLADGTVLGNGAVADKAIVGVFFSTSWCPACEAFTPLLVDFYEELEQAGKSFEIVWVSFEASTDEMFAYMVDASMPWLTLPLRGVKAEGLIQRYGVEVVPTLIVIGNDGSTISLNGRGEVVEKGAAAYDDWLALSGGP